MDQATIGLDLVVGGILSRIAGCEEYRDICEDIHAQLSERGEVDPYTRDRLKILIDGEE